MMLYLRHKITTNVQHWQIFRAKDALRARVRGHFGAARGCRVVLPWALRGPVAGGAGDGLAAWVVASFRLTRNALCHSCFPPACGAGLQNGRRWRAKRALRQPETGPVAWPCGGVAPGRRRAPLCRQPSGGAVATVCRRGGGAGASLLQLFCSRMQIFPEKVLAFRKK